MRKKPKIRMPKNNRCTHGHTVASFRLEGEKYEYVRLDLGVRVGCDEGLEVLMAVGSGVGLVEADSEEPTPVVGF